MTSVTDPSLLGKPMQTGQPTINQLINAKDIATEELLEYLEKECDAILECKVCKSLFRSMINFLSHKRAFCKGCFADIKPQIPAKTKPDSVVVVEPSDPDEPLAARSTEIVKNPNSALTSRKPKSRRKATTASGNPVDMPKEDPRMVQLRQLEGVDCAVEQTVGSESGSMLSAKSDPDTVVVEPKDGYPNMSLRQRGGKYIEIDDEFDDEVIVKPKKSSGGLKTSGRPKCSKCNTYFSCKKSLAYHMMNRHSDQRKYYPCIYCKSVFSQFYGVTRHMSRAHNLNSADIDKVRDIVRSKVFTKQIKGNAAANAALTAAENAAANLMPQNSYSESPVETMEDEHSTITLNDSNLVDTSIDQDLSSLSQGSKSDSSNSKRGRPPKNPLMKPQPQLLSDIDLRDDSKEPMQLFVCKTCNKAFGKKIALVKHSMVCLKFLTLETATAIDKTKSKSNKPESNGNSNDKSLAHNKPRRKIKPKQYNDGTILMIPDVVKVKNPDGSTVYKLKEDIEKDKQEEPEHESIDIDDNKLKVFVQGEWLSVLDKDEEAEVDKMVDGSRMICLKCKRGLSSLSDLRKHAVRHIDWKKFKCKLCRFFSFNRFDCKTHLRKQHPEEVGTLLDAGLLDYVIDLEICVFESMDAVKNANAIQLPAPGTSPLSVVVPDPSSSAGMSNPSTRTSSKEKRTITPRPSKKQESNKDTPKSTSSSRSEASPSSRKSDSTDPANVEKRPRGRPRTVSAKKEELVQAKPRGRPRKHPRTEDKVGSSDHVDSVNAAPPKTMKSVLSEAEPENDENEVRKLQTTENKSIKTTEQNKESDPQPSVSKVLKVVDKADDENNSTHNNVEDTIENIKSRKPLTADNSKAVADENDSDK